ncbi:MAG: hypothetical protein ACR2G4_06245 [Pyrinomonadaceae bacterium]
MDNTNEARYRTGDTLGDALRFLCDASYAVLPRDVAYKVGEFEKNFWGGVRWFADKKVSWIDEALSGGDRLREEWTRRYERQSPSPPPATGAENI